MNSTMMAPTWQIADLLTHAARNFGSRKIFSVDGKQNTHSFTWKEISQRSAQLAHAMAELGVKSGARVATLAWNHHRHLEVYFAGSGSGAVVHTINPRLAEEQLIFIINHSEDKVLFIEPEFVPLINKIKPNLPEVDVVVFEPYEEETPSQFPLICYEEFIQDQSDQYQWPTLNPETPASLCYTSGTTGQPKGVLYSHQSTILHAISVSQPNAFNLGCTSRILPAVPMFHVNAWGIPYAAALTGAELVLPNRFLDGKSLTSLIEQTKPEMLLGVPTLWQGLLMQCRETKTQLTSVKTAVVGGAAAPYVMIKEFSEVHDVFLLHAWGMTEMSPVGTLNVPTEEMLKLPDEARYKIQQSQGKALFGVELKLENDEGEVVPFDGTSRGYLFVKGPWITKSYFKQEQAITENGWFNTGDIAVIDEQGYLTIVDRAKDLIKSGGEWISSIWLEEEVLKLPGVNEAAAFAVPDTKWGERPVVAVVGELDESVAKQSLALVMPKWCVPDQFFKVDSLPKTGTGKIRKELLRQQFGQSESVNLLQDIA